VAAIQAATGIWLDVFGIVLQRLVEVSGGVVTDPKRS
jgi:hypothetical protein